MSGRISPRQLPATPRICRYRMSRGPWQYPPAPECSGVISKENNLHLFTDKPREFIYIYRYFRKFIFSGRSDWLRHHTRAHLGQGDGKYGQMRLIPGVIVEIQIDPITANAGKCASCVLWRGPEKVKLNRRGRYDPQAPMWLAVAAGLLMPTAPRQEILRNL